MLGCVCAGIPMYLHLHDTHDILKYLVSLRESTPCLLPSYRSLQSLPLSLNPMRSSPDSRLFLPCLAFQSQTSMK